MGNTGTESAKGTQNIKNITPTVIVGLGGTGWEVIKRVKERLNYYIGGLHHYACLNFLHVDTDKPRLGGWTDDAQTRHIHASRGAEGLFDGVDSYGIGTWFETKGGETVKSFDTGAGQVRPQGRLAFFANYTDGGIQAAIKDAFNNIKDKSSRERLKESPKYKHVEEKTQICIDNEGNNNVIIVASIAGGTGSGMFFDMVTALRQQMNGKGMIYAYLLFPDHYRDVANIESMRANGYAFLKELEYFQLNNSQHSLEAKWPGDRTPNVAIQAILCDRVYLFSHTDELGRVTQKEDMFDSIAESIFKDFTFGGFADEKRSAENNENTDLHTIYHQNAVKDGFGNAIRRPSSRNFQSQGYASVGMPHDQLIEACAYKMAAKVVQSWHPQHSEGHADNHTIDSVLEASGLRFSLGSLSGDSGKEGKDTASAKEIRDWCMNLKKRQFSGREEDVGVNQMLMKLLRKRNSADKSELNWLDAEYARLGMEASADSSKDAANQMESAVKDCESGLPRRWTAHLNSVSNEVIRDIQCRLEEWCRDQVTKKETVEDDGIEVATSTRLSFIDLVKVLEEARIKLDNMATRIEGPLAKGVQTRYDEQFKRYTAFLGKLRNYPEDNKVHGLRRLEKLIGILDTRKQRQLLIDQVRNCSFGHDGDIGFLEYALYKHALEACAKMLKKMCGYIDNLASNYSLDADKLSNAYVYLEDRAREARNVRSSQHVKSLFDAANEADFEAIFANSLKRYHSKQAKYIADPSVAEAVNEERFTKEDVKDISSRFVSEYGDMSKVRDALNNGFNDSQNANSDNKAWIEALISITQGPFRDELPAVCSFWSRFAQAYTSAKQQEDAIIELYENSAYWLNRNHSFTATTLRNGGTEQDTYVLVGVPSVPETSEGEDKKKMEELRTMAKRKIEALAEGSNVTIKDLPTCDELIIYRRSVALPLCYSDELPPMQEAYNEVRAAGEKGLHITKNNRVFADISLLTEQIAAASTQAVRTAALGMAFNIIKVTPKPMNLGDTQRSYDYTYVKSGIGEDVNFLGQCCLGDGVREVAEHLEIHKKDDIIADIERKVAKNIAAIEEAGDDGYTLKYWAVYCQMLYQDVPRDRDKHGTEGPRFGRELEHVVYHSLLKQALEKLSLCSWWKAEDAESSEELARIAEEQGNVLFPKRAQDGFRLWKLPENKVSLEK